AQDALDHAGRDAPHSKAGNVRVGRSCGQGHSYSYPARGHVSARQSPCSTGTATPSLEQCQPTRLRRRDHHSRQPPHVRSLKRRRAAPSAAPSLRTRAKTPPRKSTARAAPNRRATATGKSTGSHRISEGRPAPADRVDPMIAGPEGGPSSDMQRYEG